VTIPVLDARGVSKVFRTGVLGGRHAVALEPVSLWLGGGPSTVTAVAGESGSGKTTLARLLLGIIPPTAGAVLYSGADLRALRGREKTAFRKDVQAIFQDPFEVYNPFYRADRVLWTAARKFQLAPPGAARRELIEQALRAVGLRPDETLGRYPHQLSGGQRQRIMVARALMLRPRVIIADEPVSMIDASLRATILDALGRQARALDISVVYITHDLATAYQISETILVLYRGATVECGDVELVITQPQHPYTQLLVRSIPQPAPGASWAASEPAPADGAGGAAGGCRFADRCPHVMPICHRREPPLFRTADRRAVACFLYADAPEAAPSEVASLTSGPRDLAAGSAAAAPDVAEGSGSR